ncbi:MAG: ABC transporter permease [Stackebrandtia sp.]
MMTLAAAQLMRVRTMRPGAVMERNYFVHRRAWLLMLSGVAEPMIYLLGLGVGVGALVGQIALPDGRSVDYAVFVAPAMLANSAMFAVVAETTFNVFGKLKFAKLYDAVIATPLRPMDIALGEAMWALIRAFVYALAFVAVMGVMGMLASWWALLALPATTLVGCAFVGIGLTLTTFFKSWTDFDWVISLMFVMFLFSGTFTPIESYPPGLQQLVYVSPLYHGIELVRGLSLGVPEWSLLGNAAYLLAVGVVGVLISARRMGRLLYK